MHACIACNPLSVCQCLSLIGSVDLRGTMIHSLHAYCILTVKQWAAHLESLPMDALLSCAPCSSGVTVLFFLAAICCINFLS